jgi:hypothetical protein
MGYFISSVIGPRHPPVVALHAMYYTRTVFLSTDTLILYNLLAYATPAPTVQGYVESRVTIKYTYNQSCTVRTMDNGP